MKTASFVYFSFGLFPSLIDLLKIFQQSDINPLSVLCYQYLFPDGKLSFPFINHFLCSYFAVILCLCPSLRRIQLELLYNFRSCCSHYYFIIRYLFCCEFRIMWIGLCHVLFTRALELSLLCLPLLFSCLVVSDSLQTHGL